METKQVAFSGVGDIVKAHRRFKHRVEEHVYLGCQIDANEEIPGDAEIYINKDSRFRVLVLSTGGLGSELPGYELPTI